MTITTRFAPSPTGFLHVGGARTALYCWLFAKKTGGKFILRIEDTDLERSTQEAVDAILESMQWLGLNWDEGPYYQTKRFDRYKEVVQQLLDSGHAYRCYCTKERLEALREGQIARKEKPRYDGHCRNLQKPLDEPFVVRFKSPTTGSLTLDDGIHGRVVVQNEELDDLIIARQDGSPTYNFTVVVDDSDMKVTHVIRGDDHLNNTFRQMHIFEALGVKPPHYTHVPMILGDDGKRLSKRHGAVSVMQYRDEGYLPEALLNYLVRLGWSHGDQEIFTIDEMIEFFDLEHLSKSPAAFNTPKLQWLNQHYIKTLPDEKVLPLLEWQFKDLGLDPKNGPALKDLLHAQRERAKTLREMAEKSAYLYQNEITLDEAAAKKNLTQDVKASLDMILKKLQALTEWKAEAIHAVINETAEELQLKLGKIAQPMRVAVTGNTVSPPLDITLELLGQKRCLARLAHAISVIPD